MFNKNKSSFILKMMKIEKSGCGSKQTVCNFWRSDRQTEWQTYRVTKKSIPLFGVSGGTQVFAKHLNRHIFGFPAKNLTIQDQYFQRFYCQKKDICNSAIFSPTALLQISFVEIILRLPVDILLIENRISYHNKYFEGSSYICSNQLW